MPIIGHLSENYAKASDLGLGFNRPMDYEEDTHKSMPKPPKTVLLSDDQYNGLVEKVEKKELSQTDWELLLSILKAYGYLLHLKRLALWKKYRKRPATQR